MAVKLEDLYAKISHRYDVKLHTNGFFGKTISWIHTVEDAEFAYLLYGDELVFNSGINNSSEDWLKQFIMALNQAHAGGLILSLKKGHTFPTEIIDYCNQIQFPLFSSAWDTPFIDIMRIFSEILLKNEQKETNLAASLKNAIYYPDNEEAYLSHFENYGFFRDMSYTVLILSCHAHDSETGNIHLESIEKSLRYSMQKGVIYEDGGRLIVLFAEVSVSQIQKQFRELCKKDPDVYVGIGTTVNGITEIHKSYENAFTAYQLTKTAIPKNILEYDELGVYKILADVKDESICPTFVQDTIGPLIKYDRINNTEYTKILESYFENDCCILNTSKALYCHKNTLTYKLNKIKDILGYDILSNENRMKIMISFYILRLDMREE